MGFLPMTSFPGSAVRALLAVAAAVALASFSAVPTVARSAFSMPGDSAPARQDGTVTTIDLTSDSGRRTEVATAGPSAGLPGLAVHTGAIGTDPFVVAALTWDPSDDVAPGTEIFFRVREDSGWSDWLEAEVDDGFDAGGEAASGTEPFVTGGATAVQVRVTGNPDGLPSDLDLVLVSPDLDAANLDASTSPVAVGPAASGGISGGGRFSPVRLDPSRAALVPATTSASVDDWSVLEASIVTRAEWGADEEWTDAEWTPRFFPLQAAVVHHTAGTNRYDPEDSLGIVKAIFDYHTLSRGWGDIGYNYLVDQYGQAFEGRKYSLPSSVSSEVPQGWMIEAGHAYGYNKGTLGIAAMGDFTKRRAPDPTAVLSAMSEIISWRFDGANLDPAAPSGLLAPDSSTTSTSAYATGEALPRIFAHDDVAATLCPGNLYDTLGAIRAAVNGGFTRDSDTAPPTVTATPTGGIYPPGTQIELSSEEGARIFYTVSYPDPDGGLVFYSPSSATDPAIPDTRYVTPISLTTDLTVTYVAVDAAGNTSDPVTQTYVVGSGVNNPPVANAGPDQEVDPGAVVILDGSGSSDPEGDTLTYAWTQADSEDASLDDPTAVRPSFTPTVAGTYVFTLVVNDGTSDSAPDSVTVVVNGPTADNSPPIADAGSDQDSVVRTQVRLDGSGSSDPEDDVLTYAWTQADGKDVSLDDPTAAAPSFTPKVAGTYVFTLVVNDGTSDSAPDSVAVTVTR